jgi:hypothetical protein
LIGQQFPVLDHTQTSALFGDEEISVGKLRHPPRIVESTRDEWLDFEARFFGRHDVLRGRERGREDGNGDEETNETDHEYYSAGTSLTTLPGES